MIRSVKEKMYNFTIMGLDTGHIDEICEDIKEQYRSGIASCALFMMKLAPDGNPPINMAEKLCRKYDLFRNKLAESNVPSGILVQNSIWLGNTQSGEDAPFQKFIGLTDGRQQPLVCPYDDEIQKYFYNTFRTLAQHKPDHIMLDDDFRLISRAGGGCACALHIKRFNELAGTDFEREELLERLVDNSEEGRRFSELYLDTQREALLKAAGSMRAGIDSVDEHLPASFCTVGTNAEFAYEIAAVLAGKENPVTVRINNGNYHPAGARNLSVGFFKAAAQAAKLKGKADVILAETDTCPQNRYSTGAMSLHAHFTGTILEGAMGAKHWITRLSSYEPASGRAYRRVLSEYSGFYEALAELVPKLRWCGCRMAVFDKPYTRFGKDWNMGEDSYSAWGECVLERLGIPMYFSSENGGALCLEGEVKLGDSDILKALGGTVLLASDSAESLIKRGFGEYLGVDIREWNGKRPTVEKLSINGNYVAVQQKIKELVITDSKTASDSYVYNTVDNESYTPLFPGTAVYKNSLGGTVFTFCGTPRAAFHYTEAFSFLNYSRKQQFLRMLRLCGELPVFYPDDEEVYLKAAYMPDGSLLCAVFNIGLDPIRKLELVFAREIAALSMLMPDGSRKEVSFTVTSGKNVMDIPCNILEPVIIFAEFKS